MLLDEIKKENDIKNIPLEQLPQLAGEIRTFLLEHLSKTGGHLASNLGAVELTMALHYVLCLPEDKIIWDVGHQSYTHKILTGRKEGFEHLRMLGGMSGFPKRSESPCDSFDTGHSSTSISAGMGYVCARDLNKENYQVVSVIGDGALTGGMAYEALNNASQLKSNFIIVLNDNEMSISKNVGGISSYLGNLRTAEGYNDLKIEVKKGLNRIPGIGPATVKKIHKAKDSMKRLLIPGMFFEDMGITYLGPINGHDCARMIQVFQEARKIQGPVLVHVKTEKGRGYEPAMRHPARFHGTAAFDLEHGIPLNKNGKANYTDIFSTVMRKFGDREEKVVAVTAAMPDGTGLKRFRNMFPDRFFDVGIAEEHAVTFAAGLALGGLIPVVAVYSSFLQRAIDQIIEDVCLQKLHVIFAVDRAGLVGSDGETHQGCFDLTYLSMIPNMTVMAPKNKWELSDMLKFAVKYQGPIAIRYPRGEAYDGLEEFRAPIVLGRSEFLFEGEKTALLPVGSMVKTGEKVYRQLKEDGENPTLINARFVKPLDEKMLDFLAAGHSLIVTMEENVKTGGFGMAVADYMRMNHPQVQVLIFAVPDQFVEHGNPEKLKEKLGLDPVSIYEKIKEAR
ncbi:MULTISPECIES: 1-deoxy-D-xylulose-5-phosphate synthase [unclassified Blautia]|uniref:1-deoxy-D-xylulose-5-phosphate synthase n=1 Tax=unclassified Blautia TaxID=2648079 RepID=UPI000B382D2F|nr:MULTISPECIES: 1-deoxy-D-xylulose-5-phosphate synthase [unclassified Blautia]OUN31872.1 1-deoxy-D-xylulose-5-phosphate synthase [Blautia sp. An81]OUN95074.1 1-deoxy-D-xylulose-5-phosphate synthase [Blautia sp. An46]